MNNASLAIPIFPASPPLKTVERLDLVEYIFQIYTFPDLQNISVVGAQHILPSTFTMLQSFFDRGLLPSNVFLIGKCYSTDIETYKKLRELGVYVCPSSLEFKKSQKFDNSYNNNISNFIDYTDKQYKKLETKIAIILDDGGALISHLNKKDPSFSKMVGVEQTTSGYAKIKNLNLNMCVVNVARSHAKLKVESKIVAQTAINALLMRIANSGNIFLKKILIIGNGAIGSALANRLEGLFNVTLVDVDPQKSDLPYEECLKQLDKYDLIVGCAGTEILDINAIKGLKKGTTLVSLSSSDREFDIVPLRKKARDISSCHNDFIVDGVRVLNCGFPVNFNGIPRMVDIEEFSLTRALLTLGVLQAIEMADTKGLVELSKHHQAKLLEKFFSTCSTHHPCDSSL